jgi:hypothetical protein
MNHPREELKRQRTRAAQSASEGSSESFHLRLAAYAMAAGAAGVGLLAATPPANAEVVYTPAHTNFTNGTVYIDVNHDGINDFVLSIYNFATEDRRLAVRGLASQNGVLGYSSSGYSPQALKLGQRIGRGANFFQNEAPAVNVADTSGTIIEGPFPNVGKRFLGLKFNIEGQTHYGWAVITVTAGVRAHKLGIDATLLGYAYETVAGEALVAGEGAAKFDESDSAPRSGTLGMLALGAPALALWRREDGQG